jgi:hypothetical protein
MAPEPAFHPPLPSGCASNSSHNFHASRVEHQDVPVAVALRPAFDRHVRRDRVRPGVAFLGVVEFDGNLRLILPDDDILDADPDAFPFAAEIRMQRVSMPMRARIFSELGSTGSCEMSRRQGLSAGRS